MKLAMNLCPCPVCSTENVGYFPSVKVTIELVDNCNPSLFETLSNAQKEIPINRSGKDRASRDVFAKARGGRPLSWEMKVIIECKHLEARSDLTASIDDDRDFFYPMKIDDVLRRRLEPELYLSKKFLEIEDEWISDVLRGDPVAGKVGIWKSWENKCRAYRRRA